MDLAYKTFMFCWIATILMIVVGCAATSEKIGQAHDVDTASNAIVMKDNKVNPLVAGFIKEVQGSLKNEITANRDANTKNIGEVSKRIDNGDKWNTRMQTAIIGCCLLQHHLHAGFDALVMRIRRRKKKRPD